MGMGQSLYNVARFGVFEVDLRAAELRKHGIRLKLQEQPFQILSLLIERQGDVVTRDELRHRLWPDHTFVDFDRSLNKAMTKLRSALGDSAESPRYIETLYRRGYRLLVPVTIVATQNHHAVIEAPGNLPEQPTAVSNPIAARGNALSRAWPFLKHAALTCLVLALAVLVYGRYYHSLAFRKTAGPVTPKRSVAVLGFKNLSADPHQAWLSTALSEWLSTELSTGEQLRIIPAESVARMKIELPLQDLDELQPSTLERIRKDLGTDLVVVGSYAMMDKKSGDRIRLDLRLQETGTGETLDAVSQSGTASNLFELVSQAGQRLRASLRVPAATQEEQALVAIELPSNLEAARLYSEGLEKLREFNALTARDLLERSISEEPTFALAHAALAATWQRLGYDENAKVEAKKAYDLSAKLSRADRLIVEARYREASRDWNRAIEIYGALFEFFPDNLDYGLALSDAQINAEKGPEGLSTIQTLRQLPAPLRDDPRLDLTESRAAETQGDFRRSWICATRAAEKARASGASLLLANALLAQAWASENLGDFDKVAPAIGEARAASAAAHDLGLVASTVTIEAIALQMEGDFPGAKERYQQALFLDQKIGNLKGVAAGYDNLGDAFLSLGDLSSARKSYENSVDTYKRIAHQDGIGLADAGLGDVLLAMGQPNQATQRYNEALEICRQLGDRSKAASALMGLGRVQRIEGDLAGAERTESEALSAYQEIGDTLSTARTQLVLAQIDLDNKKVQKALAAANTAADSFEKVHSFADAGHAYLLLSEILLAQNRVPEAQKKVAQAVQAAQSSRKRELSFMAAVGAARVQAASGNPSDVTAAERRLSQTLVEAGRSGFTLVALEARLAHGEVELNYNNHEAGIAELEALQKDASRAGLTLIAQKATRASRPQVEAEALTGNLN
jgi:eukaryotic-like serine/threonine-protein kinase